MTVEMEMANGFARELERPWGTSEGWVNELRAAGREAFEEAGISDDETGGVAGYECAGAGGDRV